MIIPILQIPANNNKNKLLIRSYNNQQIRKISEFEFLIEKQDIIIGKNQELIEDWTKTTIPTAIRMRVPVRIFANELLLLHILSDYTLG